MTYVRSAALQKIFDSVKETETKPKSISQLRAVYEKTIKDTADAKGRPVHFYDRLLRKYNENPTVFNNKLDQAIQSGKDKAADLINKVRDFKNSKQDQALETYRTVYGADPSRVFNEMVDDEMKAANVQPLQFRNQGYEDGLLSNCVAATADEVSTLSSLQDLMNKKHWAEGYDGDSAVVAQFQKENLPLRGTIARNIVQ
jgi:hypothetical protein